MPLDSEISAHHYVLRINHGQMSKSEHFGIARKSHNRIERGGFIPFAHYLKVYEPKQRNKTTQSPNLLALYLVD